MTTRKSRTDAPARDALGTIVLYDLSSPINIGQILRVCETFKIRVGLFDPRGIVDAPEKRKVVSDFACGALERAGVAPFDLEAAAAAGRLIATTTQGRTSALPRFRFEPTDVVLIGNEYDGLPREVMRRAAKRLRIPMPNVHTPKPASSAAVDADRQGFAVASGAPVLSAAMTAGVIAYTIYAKSRRDGRGPLTPPRA